MYWPFMFIYFIVMVIGAVVPVAVLYLIVKLAVKNAVRELKKDGII